MNNQQLVIRPTPKSGETLSSYIQRAAILNGYDENDIWREVNNASPSAIKKDSIHRLDYDYDLIHPNKLSELSGIKENIIINLTFYKVCVKFIDDPYANHDYAMFMIRKWIDNNKKYCPVCMKQDNAYKLIWRIKDINHCYIHNIKLKNTIEKLSESTHKNKTNPNENSLYQRWNYLLDEKKILTNKFGKLNLEQSLALKLLYTSQNQPDVYVENKICGITIDYAKKLVLLIRGSSNMRKVTIASLFASLDYYDMDIEEFVSIDVPMQFLNSILEVKRKNIIPPNICKASWCCHSEKLMRLMNNNIRRNGIRYYYYYVCTGCFMKYSYSSGTNNWVEIDDKINRINQIKELVKNGYSKNKIDSILRINYYEMSEIIGYLAYNKLLPDSINNEYSVRDKPENIVKYFESISCSWNSSLDIKYRKLKEMYGWDLKKFSYLYSHHEVQLYYMTTKFDVENPKKQHEDLSIRSKSIINEMILSNSDISLNKVAEKLNCSVRTLYVHNIGPEIKNARKILRCVKLQAEEENLRNIFDNIISNYDNKEFLRLEYFLKDFGRTRDYIQKYFPSFIKDIIEEVRKTNIKVCEYQDQLIKERSIKIIHKKYTSQKPINVTAIAKELGFVHIHDKFYKNKRNIIEKEINKFLLKL